MDTNDIYLLGKYSKLMHGLFVDPGNAKVRLQNNEINLILAFAKEFPPTVNEYKQKITDKLTKYPELKEDNKTIVSSYRRSIGKMRHSQATDLLNDIYELNIKLLRALNYQY